MSRLLQIWWDDNDGMLLIIFFLGKALQKEKLSKVLKDQLKRDNMFFFAKPHKNDVAIKKCNNYLCSLSPYNVCPIYQTA